MGNDRRLLVIAHRGGNTDAPENTLASFKSAISHHVDGIETDLRVTKDGVVVLHHDPTINKHDKKYPIGQLTYEEILRLQPDVVTLEQFISFVDHRAQMMLEIKEMAAVPGTIKIVKRHLADGYKPGEFIFASFQFDVLKKLQLAFPNIELIVLEKWSGLRAFRRAKALRTPYLSMDQRFLWWGFVRLVSGRYRLFSYPFPNRFKGRHVRPARWQIHGLHGVITDKPAYFK